MIKYLAIVIGILFVIPTYGQRKKKENEEITTSAVFVEGITYSLPRTGIRVYVKATKEAFVPGPYAGYAEQLLGLKDVRTRPETKWTVTEVRIDAFSEPDPEQVYKAMGDAAYKINLTADGRISGINLPNVTPQPTAFRTNKVAQIPDTLDNFSYDYLTDTPFYNPGDSTNSFKPMRVSVEQKAAEAAKRVLDLRMYRFDMAAGMMDVPHPDGESFKISLNELIRMEKNYVSLFAGRTTKKEDIFSFNYIPTKAIDKGEVIFRVSDDTGVVPATDLSGKPVMVEFEIEKTLIDKYEKMSESENPDAGESGIYYRMPAIANVKIINDLNTIAITRLPIAQFGVVAPLPEEVVQGGYQVKYHPATGAIQSVYKR